MVALGFVIARYDKGQSVPERMAASAREAADAHGADVVVEVEVPGSYDTPLAADRLARRDDVEAVVVLGAIVTGDTDHDQVIGHAAARKLADIAVERDTPVVLGITGPGQSAAEAEERVEKGAETVESAIDLAEELGGV